MPSLARVLSFLVFALTCAYPYLHAPAQMPLIVHAFIRVRPVLIGVRLRFYTPILVHALTP